MYVWWPYPTHYLSPLILMVLHLQHCLPSPYVICISSVTLLIKTYVDEKDPIIIISS